MIKNISGFLEEELDTAGEVTKGYEYEVVFKIKYDGKKYESKKVILTTYKIKGEGWKILVDDELGLISFPGLSLTFNLVGKII